MQPFQECCIKMEPFEPDSEDETLDRLAGKIQRVPPDCEADIKLEPPEYEVSIQPMLANVKSEDDSIDSNESQLLVYNKPEEVYVDRYPENSILNPVAKLSAEDPVQCNICLKHYRSKGGVNAHKKKIHINKALGEATQCPVCGKKYTNIKSLESHLAIMHLKNRGEGTKYPCADCGRVFDKRNTLCMHRASKHPREDPRRECPHCSKVLKSPRLLKDHILKLHPLQFLGDAHDEQQAKLITRPYKCDLCNKRYTSKCVLKKHVHLVHRSEDELLPCALCPKHFKTKHQLDSHVASMHSQPWDLRTCLLCFRVLKNRPSFRRHIKYGHGLDPKSDTGRPSTLEEVMRYNQRCDTGSILPDLGSPEK